MAASKHTYIRKIIYSGYLNFRRPTIHHRSQLQSNIYFGTNSWVCMCKPRPCVNAHTYKFQCRCVRSCSTSASKDAYFGQKNSTFKVIACLCVKVGMYTECVSARVWIWVCMYVYSFIAVFPLYLSTAS